MLLTINALLGALLLVAGRRMFYFFIGVMGFIIGTQFAARFFLGPEWLTIALGILAGVILVALATSLRVFVTGIVGFLAGGSLLSGLLAFVGIQHGILYWVFYLAGGILGIILLNIVFEWALITLTALMGASLLTPYLPLKGTVSALIFLTLFVIGFVIQTLTYIKDDHD
ncbi:MAG: hypothetical protein ACP5QU_02365 [Anaerolineae bacterium]